MLIKSGDKSHSRLLPVGQKYFRSSTSAFLGGLFLFALVVSGLFLWTTGHWQPLAAVCIVPAAAAFCCNLLRRE